MKARPEHALIAACLALVAFGVWLRCQSLGFPSGLSFDEHHFVENARNYLSARPDWNDHPPLGKLLLALSMRALGDVPIAWRLPPLILGCLTIALSGFLATWAFRDRIAGFIAAALIASDGFFVAYSRTALLDGMLTCLCLASIVLALRARSVYVVILSAVTLGSACAVKFSAIVFVFPLLLVLIARRVSRWVLPALFLIPVSYAVWFGLGLALTQQPADPGSVVRATKKLLDHHAALTDWKHPLLSHWYEWLLPTRPLPMRFDALPDGRARIMTSLGNPALWWLVNGCLLLTGALAAWGLFRARRLRAWLDAVDPRPLLLFACWCAPIAPWIVSSRDSYIYHYLPAYAFGVVLAAGWLSRLYRKLPPHGLIALLALGQVSFYYAPIWGQLPITHDGIERRLFVKSWR